MFARPVSDASASAVSAAPAQPDRPARRLCLQLVISTAWLMVNVDSTVVSVALPSAARALGFTTTDRQWVLTAYSLTFGCLLLVGGRLGDMLGRKRAFQIGVAGFTLASVAGGAATSATMLITARAVQGIFAALATPAGLGLLATTFTSARERVTAFARYSAISVAGRAAGLLLGGILTEYISWRWCLYVNVVFGVAGVTGAALLLPSDRVANQDPGQPKATGGIWDIPGGIASGGGLAAIVFGFAEASLYGWGNPLAYGLIAGGLTLLGIHVMAERLVAHPLTPLRLFDRTRGASYLARTVAALGVGGSSIIITYYFQTVLGYSALTTALAFLPFVGGYVMSSQLVQRQALARYGPKVVITALLLVGAVGAAWLAQIGPHTGYGSIAPSLILFGFGIGGLVGATTRLGLEVAHLRDVGAASAVTSASFQIGQSVGVGLLNTIAVISSAAYLAAHGEARSAQVPSTVHGDVVALLSLAGIFAGAALASALLYPRFCRARNGLIGVGP
jgi:MFS family permease